MVSYEYLGTPMIDVTVRQLRAFSAVLETGSFSEAAKTMHLSQAALSGLIRELERRVGVRLLDRTTRSVAPTTVGSAFDPMVRRVLSGLDEALESLGNLKELRRGSVRVAAPEPLSCTLLPKLIASYNAKHPDVEVKFADVPMAQVFERLSNGSAEIGFGPIGAAAIEAIETHMLAPDAVWVALRPDDPLANGKDVSWRELRDRPLLNYMPNLVANILSNVPSRFHPKEIQAVNRINTALSMLKVRGGAVISPAMAEPLVRGFGLRFLPLRRPTVWWRVALFTRQSAALSPAAERFLDLALGSAYARAPTP